MDKKAYEKLVKARTGLLIDQPFFGTLAMRLKLVEDTSVQTLSVDSKTVLYNPAFILGLTDSLAKSALSHEVFHCVLDHFGAGGRGINLEPEKWNWAADYVVNDMLKQAGMELGEGWLYDAQYTGMTAEQIYAKIPTPPPSGGGGSGSTQPGPSSSNPGPLDQLQPGSPDPAVQQMQAAEWKVATVQAANAAKAVGKLHESMEAFVDSLKQPKINWAEQLRRFISSVAKNDYSYARLNRKMQAVGHHLPGLYSEEMGTIFIGNDESGSVSKEIIEAFGAELRAIKEDLRPEKMTVAHFAVEVGKVEEFGPDDPFELTRFCNGGTDFVPMLKYAEGMPVQPMCAVILTDLYGPFPSDPPPFPVLWVTINKEIAPFGETLHIEI